MQPGAPSAGILVKFQCEERVLGVHEKYRWFIVGKGSGPVEALHDAGEFSTGIVFNL